MNLMMLMGYRFVSAWLATCSLCITCIFTAQLNRVVFQTKKLGTDEIVQCYGHCTIDGGNNKRGVLNITQCQGPKVYLGCKPGYDIEIASAIIGRLNPDLDICNDDKSLTCKVDATSVLKAKCQQQSCNLDTRQQQLFAKNCRKIKFVAMDIKYSCIYKHSTEKNINLNSDDSFTNNGNTEKAIKNENTNSYWLMTSYSAVTDNELISSKLSSLLLTLLLAVLFGLIIGVSSFCIVQECDKRNRKYRLKKIRERFLFRKVRQKSGEKDCIEDNELAKMDAKMINLNQYYPTHETTALEELLCNQISYNNNICGHDQTGVRRDPYSKSILKEIPEDKIVDLDQDSPLALPLKRRQYSLFSDDTSLPVSRTTSSNSLELSSDRQYSINSDVNISNLKSSESSDNETKRLLCNNSISADDDDDVFIEPPYNRSDENPTSPHFPRSHSSRSLRFHRTDSYVIPTNVKFAKMQRHVTSKDELMQDESNTRSRDSKRTKTRRNAGNDKSRTYIQSAGNNEFVVMDTSSGRGKHHFVKREEKVRKNSSHLGICSDNEIARRRNHYPKTIRHNSSSSCSRHEIPRYVLYCSSCGKSERTHFSHSANFLSNLQSSHGSLPAAFRQRMRTQEPCFCEETEHSQDTGTDSLYSSTFSTDQEDSRMFAPIQTQCVQTNSYRAHHTCNNSYSLPRAYNMQHNCCRIRHCSHRVSVDTPSSMEGTSSKESVRIFRESAESENENGIA